MNLIANSVGQNTTSFLSKRLKRCARAALCAPWLPGLSSILPTKTIEDRLPKWLFLKPLTGYLTMCLETTTPTSLLICWSFSALKVATLPLIGLKPMCFNKPLTAQPQLTAITSTILTTFWVRQSLPRTVTIRFILIFNQIAPLT